MLLYYFFTFYLYLLCYGYTCNLMVPFFVHASIGGIMDMLDNIFFFFDISPLWFILVSLIFMWLIHLLHLYFLVYNIFSLLVLSHFSSGYNFFLINFSLFIVLLKGFDQQYDASGVFEGTYFSRALFISSLHNYYITWIYLHRNWISLNLSFKCLSYSVLSIKFGFDFLQSFQEQLHCW